MEIPSPTLLIGENAICRSSISSAKKKYSNYDWIEVSIGENLSEIREMASNNGLFNAPKVLVIKDIPNKKDIRDFLLDLVRDTDDMVRFILWDTENFIKPDPKTQCFAKTWQDFIENLKKINGFKLLNVGFNFTEKEEEPCIQYVAELFKKNNKTINHEAAKLFVSILGKNKTSIKLEVEKFCLAFKDVEINREQVLNFTYPSNRETILYRFNDCLDQSYESSILFMNNLLEIGINPNILVEIMMKKVRWQLAIAHMYTSGVSLHEIPSKLMLMGKFPSYIWRDPNINYASKKKEAEKYEEPEDKTKLLISMGLPDRCIKNEIGKVKTESIPMDFMAVQLVENYNRKYIAKIPKDKLLDIAIENYKFVSDQLKEIRYGEDQLEKLYLCVYKLMEPNNANI